MNYYPFHIGDYLSATRHLTWAEDCAFRRLLDVYYTTEKPLPLDDRAVFRLVIASTDEQREAIKTVLREFFVEGPDGWSNKRADAEIESMREKQQKQRDKANRRWDLQRAERGNAPAVPQQAEQGAAAQKAGADAMPPTPTPTPTPKKEEKRASALPRPDDVSEAAWDGWVAHRKAKRATITQLVVEDAREDAKRNGMSLDAYLRAWCRHGTQGFQASWVKPHERAGPTDVETFQQRAARQRVEAMSPRLAAKAPGQQQLVEVIDGSTKLIA